MSYQDTVAAATAVVGYDLFTGKEMKQDSRWRKIDSFALAGSTAVADAAVELWAGKRLLGRFYVSSVGAAVVPMDDDRKYLGKWVAPSEDLRCIVIDAPNANPLVYEIKLSTSTRRRRFYRTSNYSRTGTYPNYRTNWGYRRNWGSSS